MLLSLLLTLQAQQLPAPTGYVNDFAAVLEARSRAPIQAIVDEVKQKSGGEIVLVTMRDLGGRPSIELARDIGREWKVGAMGAAGDRARNAGVVLLFKPGRRPGDGQADVAIATGTGTEGFITDAQAGRIRDAIGRRAVETGNYGDGLATGVAMIAQAYAREFAFELSGSAQAPAPPARSIRSRAVFPLVLFIIFMILVSRATRRRRRYLWRRPGLGNALLWTLMSSGMRRGWSGGSRASSWSSGGGGRGFGGFGGGGGFSGGGASGRF